MIPATYPSILDSNNRTKMLVYQVPSITGLTRWVDYIPVKSPASESDLTLANTYANEGFILTSKVNDITGLVPFKDYVPIYLDSTATKAWSADNDGYIPMAELAGLLLDFTTGALDPRIAFTRATNATVTNSAGVITYAPHNLITHSEQFDNSAWAKSNVTVTSNTTTAPNGTITADTITSAAANGFIYQPFSAIAGTTYTFSCYVKSVSTATTLPIALLNASGASGIASVEFTTTGEWVRVSVTGTSATTQTAWVAFGTGGTFNTGETFYAWGAQLEIGSTATAYNSTTVKNLLGFSEAYENAAWTKSNSFVQTNGITYSEDFSNAIWGKDTSGASVPVVTANQALAPNGYQTADRIVFNKTGGVFSRIQQVIPSASGVTYTFSVWLKSATGSNVNLGIRLFTTGSNCLVTNEWQRFTISTAATGATIDAQILLFDSITGNDEIADVYVWGAQLVQGSDAGAYRRTDAAALPVYYPNHNGVVCAEKLVENTVNTFHVLTRSETVVNGGKYTISLYVKAGERTWVDIAPAGLVNGDCWFNLETGTKVSTGSAVTSADIFPAGNGWYRCTITYVSTSTSSGITVVPSQTGSVIAYQGDGTSGVYIFGAQLSDSASLDPYVLNAAAAPTAAAYYGARFDYDPVTLAPKGLLIEEQRSNLNTYSQDISVARGYLIDSTSTLLSNNAIAPDGTQTASKFSATTANTDQYFYKTITGLTIGTSYTFSIYVKLGNTSSNIVRLNSDVYSNTFNLVTLAITGTAGATISNVGNGWFRCSVTGVATTTSFNYALATSGPIPIGGGNYCWGAQLEAGAFATSYIPTAASQVTRAADIATIQGSNFYSWWNNNEGSIFSNSTINHSVVNRGLWSVNTDGNNRIDVRTFSGNINIASTVYTSPTIDVSSTSKLAYGFATFNYGLSRNGGNVSLAITPPTLPIVNKLIIGGIDSVGNELGGTIKQISYYPQRLSDSVLKGLTA